EVRVLDVVRAATGRPDISYAQPPKALTGGFWAELLAFTLTDAPQGWPRDLVARVMPDPVTARKESVIQAVMADSGFSTPVVRLAGGPDDGLGRAFMVMDRASGGPLLPGLDGAGAVAAALRQARPVPDVLAATMAELHAIDPKTVREQLDGGGVLFSEPGMLDFFCDAARSANRPDLSDAAKFLVDHPLPRAAEVVCHGDLHPFNVLTDDGRVTVLDWSAALVAPRAYDVAFTTL